MAIIFSPVTQDVLEGSFQPRPRHAFIMAHSAEQIADEDEGLAAVAIEELERSGFEPIKATDIPGTGDYLEKIINLIRGCGFGVAVFSPYTPAPTLGNIFFEVGMCHVFGRPVLMLKTDEAKTPSDFVRTEWVSLKRGKEDRFRQDVRSALQKIAESADFFQSLGDVAMEAEDVDYELAFERYKQAVLIGGNQQALARIEEIYDLLERKPAEDPLRMTRLKLRRSVGHFVKLVPGA